MIRHATTTERHLITFALFAVPLAYWPYLKDYTLGPKLLVWLIALAFVVIIRAVCGRGWHTSPLTLPALVYLTIGALSLTWATDPVIALVELTKLSTGVLLMLVLSDLGPAKSRPLAKGLVAAAAASAVLGALQNWDLAVWSIPSAGLPSGTLGFRNIAAMVTIQTIPFAIWLTVREKRGNIAWAGCLTLLVAFLIQTRTRGAWLGLAVAVVVIYGLTLKRRRVNSLTNRRLLVVAVLAGFLLSMVPRQSGKVGPQDIDEKKTTIAEALGSITDEGGDRGRLDMWSGTLAMIAARPMGVGLGNWAIHYPKYDNATLVTFDGSPSRPHNDFLGIASELGWPGIAAFIWILVTAFRLGTGSLSGKHADLAATALASLIAVLIHSCFSFPRDRATPTLLFWFALGLIACLHSSKKKPIRLTALWSIPAVSLCAAIALTARLLTFESHLYNALIPEKAGEWEKVVRLTSSALDVGRFHAEPLHLHGFALNTLGRHEEAVGHYTKHESLRPHDVQFLNGFAIALQNTGDLAGGVRRYRQARTLVARSTDLDYNLATLLIQMKQPQEAVALLADAAREEPADAAVLFHLGNARAMMGDDFAAIPALEQAVHLEARLLQAWMILGELYLRTDQPTKAHAAFGTFLELNTADNPYTRRARLMIERLVEQGRRKGQGWRR